MSYERYRNKLVGPGRPTTDGADTRDVRRCVPPLRTGRGDDGGSPRATSPGRGPLDREPETGSPVVQLSPGRYATGPVPDPLPDGHRGAALASLVIDAAVAVAVVALAVVLVPVPDRILFGATRVQRMRPV